MQVEYTRTLLLLLLLLQSVFVMLVMAYTHIPSCKRVLQPAAGMYGNVPHDSHQSTRRANAYFVGEE